MICPHCKANNNNETAVICAYCKQNMYPNENLEEKVQEMYQTQQKNSVFSVIKVLLIVVIIAVVVIMASVLLHNKKSNPTQGITDATQNQITESNTQTTTTETTQQMIVPNTQAPTTQIPTTETTTQQAISNPKLYNGWADITIGGNTISLPKVTLVINNNIVQMPCTLKSFLEQSKLSIDDNQMPPNNITPSSEEYISFLGGDLTICILNFSSKTINVEECLVYKINSSCNGNNYQLPAGFAPVNQVTPQLIKETFGTPNSEVDISEENYQELEYSIIEQTENGASGLMYEFCFKENKFWTSFTYGINT